MAPGDRPTGESAGERRPVAAVHVILPAYNEEESLPPLLERLLEFRKTGTQRLTVWVVDDGSADRTAEIVSAGVDGLDLRLIPHPRNLGLGQAINTGIATVIEAATDDDVAVIMDADDTHPVTLIDPMVEHVNQGADIVVASRYVEGGDDATAPAFRRLLSRGAAVTFRLLLPLSGQKDFTSGYRCYRVPLLRRVSRHWGERLIVERGFACMVELLLKLRHWGPVIREVPLVLRYDRKQGASKLKLGRTLLQYLKLGLRDRLSPPPIHIRD